MILSIDLFFSRISRVDSRDEIIVKELSLTTVRVHDQHEITLEFHCWVNADEPSWCTLKTVDTIHLVGITEMTLHGLRVMDSLDYEQTSLMIPWVILQSTVISPQNCEYSSVHGDDSPSHSTVHGWLVPKPWI